ncbi:MAG: hypothetical protein Q8S02_01210 [Hydrogenophaga sp.]|nr:hypothetical protein [Hydrogenophaga sp.]
MKAWIFFAILIIGVIKPTNAQNIQYSVHTENYVSVTNFSNCHTNQLCVNYGLQSRQSGSFIVASPFASNLSNQDISPLVISYSFSDGINTYNSSDPNARIHVFRISTDSNGKIINPNILLLKWLSGNNGSHSSVDRLSYLFLGARSVQNVTCSNIATAPTGIPDSCESAVMDSSSSRALPTGPLTWLYGSENNQALPVPALSEWALAALILAMIPIAYLLFGRRI